MGHCSRGCQGKNRVGLANRTIRQLDQLFQNNLEWWTRTAIIYA